MEPLKTVYIGIGSNLGNPLHNCQRAIDLLCSDAAISSLRCSPWYQSEPYGPVKQQWFINAVLEIQTRTSPDALLALCQTIETQLHRVRVEHWGPRTLDLDILLWESHLQFSRTLRIPHPGMHLRRFVLKPLSDLVPDLRHPLTGKTIRQLLVDVDDILQVIKVSETSETFK